MKRSHVMIALPWVLALSSVLALAGCGTSSPNRAPIVDHSFAANGRPVTASAYASGTPSATTRPYSAPAAQGQGLPPVYVDDSDTLVKDWRPHVYTVQAGDTLYGIAFNFGLDYHDLAALNNISDPTVIHVGQVLRLLPGAAVGAAATTVNRPPVAHAPAQPPVVSEPKVEKLPYSAQAVAQIQKQQAVPIPAVATVTPPVPAHPAAAGSAAGQGVYVKAGVAPGNVGVKWEMPASGRIVAGFSEVTNKGIDIAGKLGQPVYASAPGKVVYAGSGLRGYGKLVIIKHNDVYLSAYAHNDKLLVKEGQMVSQGQMIAQMGSSDADRVALHFEIRRLGRPVDPAKYLVLPKS